MIRFVCDTKLRKINVEESPMCLLTPPSSHDLYSQIWNH